MRPYIQSFSLGLITATLIIGIVLLVSKDESIETQNDEPQSLSTKKAETILKDEGFAVLPSEEYQDLLLKKQQLENMLSKLDEKKQNEEETEQSDNNNVEETETTGENQDQQNSKLAFELVIEPGMTSIDIANLLYEHQIISNADDFNQYLETNDYSRKIQLGQYSLTNEMDYEDISKIITKSD